MELEHSSESRLSLFEVYRHYLKGRGDPHRQAQSAMGYESGKYLEKMLPEWGPATVLDLGSGFSSVVLRRYAARMKPTPQVVTVDQFDVFLRLTQRDCAELQLPDGSWHLLHEFKHTPAGFELVVLDLAGVMPRVRLFPQVDEWLVPGGRLVLDDWQMVDSRAGMEPLLKAHGYGLTVLESETRDEFGRYLAVANKPHGALGERTKAEWATDGGP